MPCGPPNPRKAVFEARLVFATTPAEFDVRNVISVIEMENGAIGHGARQIERPAAIGKEFDFRRLQHSIVGRIRPRNFAEKRMTFPGDHHVLVAIQSNPNFATGLSRGERGECGDGRGLRFFSTKTAAHARTFHDHAVHRQAKHVRDDVLHFRWMLGRRTNEHRSILAALRPGRVRLEIKMILAADGKFAFEC